MLPLDRDAPATEGVGGCGAAVVMLHDCERDPVQVQALLAAGVAYVGVLGPRRRSLRTSEDLARLGARELRALS